MVHALRPSEVDRDSIEAGITRAIWISSWADAWERAVEEDEADELPWPSGAHIDEYAPDPPDWLYQHLGPAIAKQLDDDNTIRLEEAYVSAVKSRYDAPEEEDEFGWQIGMNWLGHGTAFPDIEGVDYKVGWGEFALDVGPGEDDAEVSWSSVELPEMEARRKYGARFVRGGTAGLGKAGTIAIDVEMDRTGSIILKPRSEKVRAQMRKHNQEWLGHPNDTVFLQEGFGASEFLDRLPPALRGEVEEGWEIVVDMDPWEFGHYVGYDFHEVIDPDEGDLSGLQAPRRPEPIVAGVGKHQAWCPPSCVKPSATMRVTDGRRQGRVVMPTSDGLMVRWDDGTVEELKRDEVHPVGRHV